MKQIAKFLDRILGHILTALLLFLATILFVGVIFRFMLNNPITWVDELSRYSLVAITFLGIGHVTKENKEILVTIIDLLIPKIAKTHGKKICVFLDFLADAIVIWLLTILVYYGIGVAKWRWPVKGETIEWIRIGHVYALIPLGSAIGLIYFARRWYLYFKNRRGNKESNEI